LDLLIKIILHHHLVYTFFSFGLIVFNCVAVSGLISLAIVFLLNFKGYLFLSIRGKIKIPLKIPLKNMIFNEIP